MQLELKKVIDYIEDNLTVEFSLNEIAKFCNYSPYHFSVLFHQSFGETMKSYLMKRRLTLAAKNLRNTEQRIIDIAVTYGYSSQEAFSRAFNDLFGIAPNQYRQGNVPIQEIHQKNRPSIYNNGGSNMMEKTIRDLQKDIVKKPLVKVLHILNGMNMLDQFGTNELMTENATYVPFNEAMCWGETTPTIFSDIFIEKRAQVFKTTVEGYTQTVIAPLKPLFEETFDIIVLWFGDDMFCQMNLITLLAYLEQIDYQGDVLFCMALERKHEMLDEALEVDPEGYLNLYMNVLCNQRKTDKKVLPVTHQAINMYLNYRTAKSPILKYIQHHIENENMMTALFELFPEYGLGDLQYQMMMDEVKKKD